ncbi:MAG: thymidine phosphorylase [Myxococcota bacterium]|nr:thymidine phosphorylase [Myxococcota bacterium]
MKSDVELIADKRNGCTLKPEDIKRFVADYATGKIPDYQMASMAMAIYFRGLTSEELGPWTEAMLHSGRVIDLSHIKTMKVDKHSTGGVGDKISLPLAPLVAACGVPVPMISGRGLGHTGGTLDKLESIPGFRTDLDVERFISLVETIGVGLIGQTADVCPADKKLYALRDVTATVESIPLISSSIMSKKLAEGIDALVLDVKVGSGAFMKTVEDARELAQTMVGIGESMGKRTVALLTDMNQPLGRMVGNALEVRESIDILSGRGPEDVRELTLALAEVMLELAGVEPSLAKIRLDDGSGLARFADIIEAQGGDRRVIEEPGRLPTAKEQLVFTAQQSGVIESMDTRGIGMAAVLLGAGRLRTDDLIDPSVGIELDVRLGDRVDKGQPLGTIHHNGDGASIAKNRLEKAIVIGDGTAIDGPLVIERIG